MCSSLVRKRLGNRSAQSSTTIRNCRPWALGIGKIFTSSSNSAPAGVLPADDEKVARVELLQRRLGALEPGAGPVLRFVDQHGIEPAAIGRAVLQPSQQPFSECAVVLAVAEIEAAAYAPAMKCRHPDAPITGQRPRQM